MSTPSLNPQAPGRKSLQQFATFFVGDLFFGVDVLQVQEVLCSQPMTLGTEGSPRY